MLLRNLLLAFLVCLSSLFADEPLKFATWNLRYANAKDSIEGNGWNKRIQPIANAIRSKDLDVVNLQEMDEVDSIPMVAMLLAELPGFKNCQKIQMVDLIQVFISLGEKIFQF